jgi:hypothetical protein
MVKPTVHVEKIVYQKQSLVDNKRRKNAPAYSTGTVNYDKKHIDMTIHLTPECRNRPEVRNALIRHEKREGRYIAAGKPINKAHNLACKKDPKYGQEDWWSHLGH